MEVLSESLELWPQRADPWYCLTILLETTAANTEIPLRSLAVRTVAVPLTQLNSCDKQILQH